MGKKVYFWHSTGLALTVRSGGNFVGLAITKFAIPVLFHTNDLSFSIYATKPFGTVSFKDINRVECFIKKLLAGKSHNQKIILVISKGGINVEWPIEQGIYYFDYIPQLNFLNHCDLMITHGGHNSIKECLQANVPMLVYPHMEDNDQPGNAVRVQVNGFGLMGNLTKDSSDDIWNKVNTLLKSKRKKFIFSSSVDLAKSI